MRFLENEILHLIKNGEAESVEFKKSTSSLWEAILKKIQNDRYFQERMRISKG